MAHTEKPTFTSAIPAHARRVVETGVEYALWTDRLGQPVKAVVLPSGKCRRTVPRKWVGVYRDAAGVRRKTRPYSSRDAAMAAAIELERHGRAVRDGTASAHAPAGGRAHLADHLPAYLAALAAKGDTPDQVKRVGSALRARLKRHRLTTAGSVDCERLMAELEADRLAGDPRGAVPVGPAGQKRASKRGGKPLSLRTRNKAVGELRAFGRWLSKTKKVLGNPFDGLVLANVETDRRHVRRALTVADFSKLLAAARASAEVVRGLTGEDRRACYILAAYTGLRAGALAKLTPEAFTWAGRGRDARPVAVFSDARLQKGKAAHGVPIAETAGREIADWLKARPAGKPLFGPEHRWAFNAAGVLRVDLAAAGIPFRDAAGQAFDFHALRLQFGYLLASSGVPLVAAQQLMDHSSPVLTANIYSRFGGELGGEVAKLPSLGPTLGPELPKTTPEGPQSVEKRSEPRTRSKRKKS